MNKYLYGASVQGIQGFIFETNKLIEIAGASQLIDKISSINWGNEADLSEFEKYCKSVNHAVVRDNIVMSAAGNIKYKVEDLAILEQIVKGFPKHIANYAPGVTISQAVVEIEGDIQKSINALENKLKVQRNKVTMPLDFGYMGLERARRTGGVAYDDAGDVKDRGMHEKVKHREEDTLGLLAKFVGHKVRKEQVPVYLTDITKKAENSWLAIIHADGNGLGKILTNLSKKVDSDKREIAFKTFSKSLDEATLNAARRAFAEVITPKTNDRDRYPIRPVVLGGDDLTVIIRADLAYDFTKAYLKAFEEETSTVFAKNLKKYTNSIKGLTACAGIAYIKDSYPFHYGIDLAEDLTGKAKELSKSNEVQALVSDNEIPSSIAMYKVQSSFTDKLDEMKKRTHHANQSNIRFDYGPYLLKKYEGFACVDELDEKLNVLQNYVSDKSKGVSKLRQYISQLYKDQSVAKFMMDRIYTINKKFYEDLNLEKERAKEVTLLNDLLQLHTFNQAYKTNNNED